MLNFNFIVATLVFSTALVYGSRVNDEFLDQIRHLIEKEDEENQVEVN